MNNITLINDFSIDTSAETASDENYSDFVIPNFPKWIILLLFFIGIFGNLLSLAVFHHMNVRKNSTYVYLTLLSIIDIAVVIFGLGDMIILFYFKTTLRSEGMFVCRAHTFLVYTFTHLSSFILAAVSVDRAIAVNLINFARRYCKPNMAYKVIVTNCFLAVFLNFHTLLFLGYESDEPIPTNIISNNNQSNMTVKKFICGSRNELYTDFLYPYFDWIDLLFYTIIPFFVMGICTFLIVHVLYNSKKRLRIMAKKNIKETKKLMEKTNKAKNSSISKNIVIKKPPSKKNKTMHLTYTLISINILFFLLLSPLSMFRILNSTFPDIEVFHDKTLANIFYMLAYANHCFNFIFYGISSQVYRETMFKILYLDKLFPKLRGSNSPIDQGD